MEDAIVGGIAQLPRRGRSKLSRLKVLASAALMVAAGLAAAGLILPSAASGVAGPNPQDAGSSRMGIPSDAPPGWSPSARQDSTPPLEGESDNDPLTVDGNPWLEYLRGLTVRDGLAAVQIERGGTISVRAGRRGLSTETLVRALHDVDVDVVTVPASPSQVGQVAWLSDGSALTANPDPVVDEVIPDLEGQSFRILPDRLATPLVIQAGVEAAPGESYSLSASAFAPGEVLGSAHCAGDDPMSSATLVRYATTAGVQVEWVALEHRHLPDGTVEEFGELVTKRPNGVVQHVEPINIDVVRATIVPWHLRELTTDEAGRTVEGERSRGAPAQGEGGSSVPCDPAEVARWR